MMRSAYEQKEDIRLRMVDLEKKLAESEEERCKLEKTCDVLMRAFREEEKMHYKILNKKYEKFLEDCSVRSRRNDLILRSLCRIEDRSRMLFAKTERLKLLKDRYVSYLKINEFKQDEVSCHLWRNFSSRAGDVTVKAVRWKTPLAMGPRTEEEFREAGGDFSRNERHNTLTNDLMPGLLDVEQCSREKSVEFQKHENQRNSPARSLPVDCHGSQMNSISVEIKSEEVASGRNRTTPGSTRNINKIEDKHPANVPRPKDDGEGGQESIEKRKKAVEYPESECHEPKWELSDRADIKPNETDPVTVKSKSFNKLIENNHYVMTTSPKNSSYKEDDSKNKFDLELENVLSLSQEKDILSEISPKPDKALPLGLDGIDYQNETYPESYYEQPVHHHNHTSIASDVILEEDETEQELEDEEKDISIGGSFDKPQPHNSGGGISQGVKTWEQAKGHWGVGEPHMKSSSNARGESPNKGYLKSEDVDDAFENVKSRESDSEKNSEAQQSGVHSGKPRSSPSEKSEKSQTAGKSNLIHMLESDSESFQIEHGDVIPGNEDSDFDFSFSKN